MRDYVEWIGLMAVSGGLAVLLNTVLFSGVAHAQMPTHRLTSSVLPPAELCLWDAAPSRP